MNEKCLLYLNIKHVNKAWMKEDHETTEQGVFISSQTKKYKEEI